MFKHFKFWLGFAAFLGAVLFGSGCGGHQLAEGSLGTIQYSHVFQPVYKLDVINNTDLLVDIEINGDLVKDSLTPGETYSHDFWSFRDGDRVTVVTKMHRNGVYVGMDTFPLSLKSRRNGARTHEVRVADRFVLPTIFGDVEVPPER